MDWTQKFLAAEGEAVTDALLVQTRNSASVCRYLRRTDKHFLVDQARVTPRGAVRRKLEDLLSAAPYSARVPQGKPGARLWQLTDHPVEDIARLGVGW